MNVLDRPLSPSDRTSHAFGGARAALLALALTLTALWASACSAPEKTVAAPEESTRPVTLIVPGDETVTPGKGRPDSGPYQSFQNENLRAELARYLSAADRDLQSKLPAGWDTQYKFFRGKLPFQWNGDAGTGIRIDVVNANGTPQLTRYLYHQLNAGFSRPISARIRPDRIYGITRDFVVIMPSSSTPESAYENRKIRPFFDRAFQVSDANTIRYAVRMTALPADVGSLSRRYPDQKAAVAGDPANQTTYALWVRTLR
ncbi:MAG: hypothetical protein NXI24_11330 [bacterium]|nr:hypothetical protein [bacterium]